MTLELKEILNKKKQELFSYLFILLGLKEVGESPPEPLE